LFCESKSWVRSTTRGYSQSKICRSTFAQARSLELPVYLGMGSAICRDPCRFAPRDRGKVQVSGRDMTNCLAAAIIAAGVAFIPEERLSMGVIRDFTVQENAILETHADPPLAHGVFFDFITSSRTRRLVRDTTSRLHRWQHR
jgi:hypothetical protein